MGVLVDLWADTWAEMAWDIRTAFSAAPDRRYVPVGLRRRVMERDKCRCYICKRAGTEETGPDGRSWHIDHITPLSKGGQTALYNLALSCATCNQRKAAK
ncbi:MAG: HNH endonuclease [Caldilineaceae bacterium]|nr:HNH endonuclease [Caldilineaceae bacterium]